MSKEAMKLVDDEGENRAVRMFLAMYGGQAGITVEKMRKLLKMAGFDGAWPEWASADNGHLTKAGAQLWIRHLFALAEQPAQQEPVAHFGSAYVNENGVHITTVLGPVAIPQDAKLYTSPQRTWVGLTDEEVIRCTPTWGGTVEDVARAVEAKLKEKNT